MLRRHHLLFVAAIAAAPAASTFAQSSTLTGWAAIPSTFRQPGPTSGQFAGGGNGVTPPYAGQPIPGFSGVIPSTTAGRFNGLPDNGFGAQGNSADFVLGTYEFTPTFKTTGDGTTNKGPVAINGFTAFNDANGLLTDATYIANGPVYRRTNYYPTGTQIAVDPTITSGRLLTGADFDVESITRLNDGTYWVGEEFGPYLLHFNAAGTLLDLPVRHPVLRAPQNPQNSTANPSNLPSSRGFESMSRNADGSKLYLTTESSITSEADKRLLDIYEFDTAAKAYTPNSFKYRKDGPAVSNGIVTGDLTHVVDDRYIIIERDDFQGPPSSANPPVVKRLYLIDLSETNADGTLKKRLLVDLLNISDPLDIGGPLAEIPADRFNFPLQSVESITLTDANTILVGLDNNYPGGNGRLPGTPDDTEIITLRFDVPLASILVPEPTSIAALAGLAMLGLRRRGR